MPKIEETCCEGGGIGDDNKVVTPGSGDGSPGSGTNQNIDHLKVKPYYVSDQAARLMIEQAKSLLGRSFLFESLYITRPPDNTPQPMKYITRKITKNVMMNLYGEELNEIVLTYQIKGTSDTVTIEFTLTDDEFDDLELRPNIEFYSKRYVIKINDVEIDGKNGQVELLKSTEIRSG